MNVVFLCLRSAVGTLYRHDIETPVLVFDAQRGKNVTLATGVIWTSVCKIIHPLQVIT